jgi:hypothetical protein
MWYEFGPWHNETTGQIPPKTQLQNTICRLFLRVIHIHRYSKLIRKTTRTILSFIYSDAAASTYANGRWKRRIVVRLLLPVSFFNSSLRQTSPVLTALDQITPLMVSDMRALCRAFTLLQYVGAELARIPCMTSLGCEAAWLMYVSIMFFLFPYSRIFFCLCTG